MKLLEARAKAWLRARGLPVPEGRVAGDAAQAVAAARELGGRVVLKASVPAGRRGKAGAVKVCADEPAARAAAGEILGMTLAGRRVESLYVEAAIDIAEELYLSFGFGALAPQLVVSGRGGVDIEELAAREPSSIVLTDVDPLRGLPTWRAAWLWERAGLASRHLPAVAALTTRLYEAFRAADALMLEVNPLALARDGSTWVVGAMVEIDDNALFRHGDWRDLALDEQGPGGRPLNERERAVVAADRRFPGGAIRYIELEGNIALFVSGGGAGLLQHDLVVAAGGRPANHSDLSPAGVDKPAALFDAIFSHPRVRGVLVGMNYLQLLPCTVIVEALLLSARRNAIDPRRLPVVLRVFGPREEEARRLAATLPGLCYLPHGATLEDGVREIVSRVAALAR